VQLQVALFFHPFIPPDERLAPKSRRWRGVSAVMQPAAARHRRDTRLRHRPTFNEEKTMRAAKFAICIAAMFSALAPGPSAAHTHELEQVSTVFEQAITNIPGKSLVAVVVTYGPGGKSLPHRHAGSAFIYAHVLSGAIRSQVDDQPARVYHAGEGFHEVPGSHHRVSENASEREPASLLAVFVIDSQDNSLTVPDQE
jgi:quercetin dioxygenase-like cupin family protein